MAAAQRPLYSDIPDLTVVPFSIEIAHETGLVSKSSFEIVRESHRVDKRDPCRPNPIVNVDNLTKR